MQKINVDIQGTPYPIAIEKGARAAAGAMIRERMPAVSEVAVVTNPTVGPLYGDTVAESLSAAGMRCRVIDVPDGEQHKTLTTIASLYDRFLAAGLDRKSLIIALGGGVVGDMTGFAAATFLRGIPFVQMPTTLLAMVDASVGGKTGVDLPQGKNLVGAFNQPRMVIIDPEVLDTLPPEEVASGMAEVVKHGLIGNRAIFDMLESETPDDMEGLIADAVRVKVDVVSRDPFEQGERALLNLGHTFGHAFELLSNYEIKHGVAVGVGLVAAARLAALLGEGDGTLTERIRTALRRQSLPTAISGFDVGQVIAAMRHDKKQAMKKHRFIIPLSPGRCEIREDPPREAVEAAIREVIEPGGDSWPTSV